PELLGYPHIQVFLGFPVAPDNEILLGHTWVRLAGEAVILNSKTLEWRPSKEAQEWVKRGIQGRVFNRKALPARIQARGLFNWDDAKPLAVARQWAGDLDIALVVELPGNDVAG